MATTRQRRRLRSDDRYENEAVNERKVTDRLTITTVIAVIIFRVINALLVRTYFAPDEYWQSTEIAHRLVYGRGYVTWEWIEHIRGSLHPLVFAVLFIVLKTCGLDSPDNLVSKLICNFGIGVEDYLVESVL